MGLRSAGSIVVCRRRLPPACRGALWWSDLAEHSGSSVVGSALANCSVDPNAIPWLLLTATTSQGPGPFARTTYIQRVNTTGGRPPAWSGTANETVWVPYTAEYYFYRAR